ncbi:putative ferric-chelate reductase 1 [Gouania willdenowi]|uniref:putative ferric-chelate reductase 1 n=1 Tax=Gouania willdenowi TaxID=441366 RepID=UPI001054CEB0|nr:putative ferric-chelate reductase 1 [Gouania willdenowi]
MTMTVAPTIAVYETVVTIEKGITKVAPTLTENESVAPTETTTVASTETTTVAPSLALNESAAPTPSGNVTAVAVTPTPAVVATMALTSITAVPLMESVNWDGCSVTRLCVHEPPGCDPSSNARCLFMSAEQQIGRNFSIDLSGHSIGYIAATFSTDDSLGGHDVTYICAADGSTVVFITATLHNDFLILTLSEMSNGKGRVDGNKIQCSFSVVLPESIMRVNNLAAALHTGSYNATSGALGTPNTAIMTNQVDFTNPNTTVTNMLTSNSTTATPTTTSSYAPTLHHSLLQTLLVTLAVLGLAML